MWPSASKIQGAVSAIAAGPHDMSGKTAGELAVDHDGLAVDDGGFDAFAPRLEAAHAARQIVDELLLPRADGRGVEDHDVGPSTRPERAPVAEAEQRSRELGDLMDAVLQRPHLAFVHPPAEEVRAPVRAVVAREMGTAVGHPDDHAGVELGLG